MRHRLLLLLLPLFMLFAQQGAAWHELSHYHFGSTSTGSKSASSSKPKAPPADTVCDQCLAFAGVAGAVAPHLPSLDLLSFSHSLAPAVALHAAATDAPSPRSRGPPIVL